MSDDAHSAAKADTVTESDVAVSPENRSELASIFRVMGHPVRLEIMRFLAEKPGTCCGDVVASLPLAQSTVSQHLQMLKESGLVTCEVRGRCCFYLLNRSVFDQARSGACAFFDQLSAMPEHNLPELDCSQATPCTPQSSCNDPSVPEQEK